MSELDLIPSEDKFRTIADGGTLHTFRNGLLEKVSDKRSGSKFNAEWTFRIYLTWIFSQIEQLQWDEHTAAGAVTLVEGRSIGWSSGKVCTRIRIEISSRCIHAYPVQE